MEGENEQKKTRKRSAAKTLQILERGSKILDLRKNGVSFRAISAALIKEAESRGEDTRGFSYEQVRKDYKAIIQLKTEELENAADDVRAELSELLDDVILNFMPHIRTKVDMSTQPNDVDMKKKAGDVVLKAINQKADLFGVKAPTKIANPDGTSLTQPLADALAKFDKDLMKVFGDDDEDGLEN